MKYNNQKASFARRSAIALAISMCFATGAFAQSSEGSIFGRVGAPKAKITLESIENGSIRHIDANADGSFNFSKVAPGQIQNYFGQRNT